MDEKIFFYLAIVPLLGFLAQILAYWIRIPSILLLLGFGVLLGVWMNPDEILLEVSDNPKLGANIIFPFVSLAVAAILFEGGLSLRFSQLKQAAAAAVIRLCTISVLVSWVLSSFLAWWLMQFEWKLAVLLGAVLVVTGPTVIAPLLRHVRPNRAIGTVVKWEGIIIDPIGAILAVLVYEQLFHSGHHGAEAAMIDPAIGILKTLAIGIGIGCFAAAILVEVVKRYWIPDYLHGLAFLSVALGVFAISNWMMHESGLVTVTVMGIYLANQKQISIEHVVEFKENVGVFLISCLFIVLGSRLDLAVLLDVGWRGALFVLLMIAIVRPASVYLGMIGSKLSRNEQTFLAFLAPRGIVAAAVISVFALRILGSEVDEATAADAARLVPTTFLLIVGTVAFYGLAAAPLARKLGLAEADPQGILFAGADRWICDVAETLDKSGYPVALVDTNYHNISTAKMMGLDAHCKSILSEYVREEIDLAGIGRMFALTANDAVNALASREYSHFFGRENVYRLPAKDGHKGERAKLGHNTHGRELFAPCWNKARLSSAYESGFRPKLTKITESFQYEDFKAEHSDDVIVLMVIDQNNKITVNTADGELVPDVGQSVLALVEQNGVSA